MRNILLFIRRFFNMVLFIILEAAAITILATYNKTHEAVFAGIATEVTGAIGERYSYVADYFNLKKENERLVAENLRLRNSLPANFESPDTASAIKIDSLFRDTLGRIRKFNFLSAKVVNNSVTDENNFITIHRGAKQGVLKDMGVLGPDGIVGRVVSVSDNYSRIMSLLNRSTKVSGMLIPSLSTGPVEWDGKDPQYVLMRNISKSVKVQKGDTVVTSLYSDIFPAYIQIGTVAAVTNESSSSTYLLKIKTATNFYNLQHVYLSMNELLEEQKKLEAKTPHN
ncbi:MAG TPA: rod shape-determining protein MreC [Chitinophagaceae bacterium]|nr:rod shape-determining protein MreC [Chitinophagaceae bacterium]